MLQSILLVLVLGLSASSVLADRIVGGSSTVNGEFPSAVSIRGAERIHIGAGVIISNRFVLTSASVLAEQPALTIQFGVRITTQTTANQINVAQTFIHPDYNPTSHVNDIALLRLARSIPLGPNAVVATLSTVTTDPTTGALTVIGWGFEEHGGDLQKELQKATLNVVSNAQCTTQHRDRIYGSNICAGYPSGIRGPCGGDLGGPLMRANRAVVGIVSWFVEPCGRIPFPAVFTRVSHYLCWINSVTGITF